VIGGELGELGARERIAAGFACRVVETYGSHEAPMLAAECEAGSLHLCPQMAYVEVVDEDGRPVAEGEPGELLVSLLHNTEMPLLRYRLGDVGAVELGGCGCGRDLPRLSVSVARREETVALRGGRWLHPRFLRTIYEAELGDALRAFHTRQEALDSFTVFLDLEGPPPPGLEERIASSVGTATGCRAIVSVRLDPGAARAPAASGKRRTFSRRPHLPA
jgi:phenylacetate-CoA ligase